MRLGRVAVYRTIGILVLVLSFAAIAQGQVSPSPFVVPQYFTSSGQPCAGCQLASFSAGTSTPLATYADPAGVFPNSNPIILDSAGRARIYLTGASYKLVLSTAGGTQIWSVDQVAGSSNSLLASNNTWTGVNTFQATTNLNGPVNMGVGFTSLGPNNMSGGGSLAGTYSGSPVFSGTPNFSGGAMGTNLTLSGQLAVLVATGTAPFFINSQTQVGNLNASFLEGFTWESPGFIGLTTPSTGAFTTLKANTSFVLNGATPLTSVQGNGDVKLLAAGTSTGATGAAWCKDANGGATTVGCTSALSGVSQLQIGIINSPCTPPSSSTYESCNSVLTWPVAFADSSYYTVCTAFSPNYQALGAASNLSNGIYIASQTASASTVTVQNLRGAANTPNAIFCIAAHP